MGGRRRRRLHRGGTFLVARGDVDPERLAIVGGSAGGYTTLAALAFRDVFSAGISWFGVGDLESSADSHKFESRYMDRLVGPYPAAADRLPRTLAVHFLDRISCPVLVLQGLDDRSSRPPRPRRSWRPSTPTAIPYAYLAFEGEGHGFRGARLSARRSRRSSRSSAQVFGFIPAGPGAARLPGLDEWRRRRAGAERDAGSGGATALTSEVAAVAPPTAEVSESPPTTSEPAQPLSTHRSPMRNASRSRSHPSDQSGVDRRTPNPTRPRRPRQKQAPHRQRSQPSDPSAGRTTKPKTSTADEASAAD